MLDKPNAIPVGQEPPPMPSNGEEPTSRPSGRNHQAKGKAGRRKTADRFAVLNAFVDGGMAGLSRVELATWLVLYRDTRDGIARTSTTSIAQRIGCSKQAVVDAVGRLRRRGLLVRVFKGNNIRGPSVYRVWPMPKPPKQ